MASRLAGVLMRDNANNLSGSARLPGFSFIRLINQLRLKMITLHPTVLSSYGVLYEELVAAGAVLCLECAGILGVHYGAMPDLNLTRHATPLLMNDYAPNHSISNLSPKLSSPPPPSCAQVPQDRVLLWCISWQ